MALREGGFVESLGPIRATPFHGAAYTAGTSANRPPGSPHGPLAWADQLDNSSWRGPTAVPFRSYAATAPSRPANPRTYGPTGQRHHVRRTIISPPTALSDFQVLHGHYVDN
jgi:hypothetical protein